jgi:hypothetical protein
VPIVPLSGNFREAIEFAHQYGRVWILSLNDMRSAHVEDLSPAFCAETAEELRAFLLAETVPTYQTHNRWGKTFREGGPLEWFNRPRAWDHCLTHYELVVKKVETVPLGELPEKVPA